MAFSVQHHGAGHGNMFSDVATTETLPYHGVLIKAYRHAYC
jgi:hypothetical protein